MKAPSLLTLGGLSLMLASCGTFNNLSQPLSGGSDFDPLSSPGSSAVSSLVVAPTSPSYTPGQWVETSMDNATFFSTIPSGNARADKVLPSGTPMKVVSNKGTYVRVELDSGMVGFVPEIMIAERRSPNEIPLTGPEVPLPDMGSVPPLVEPGIISGEEIAPPPEIPGTPPPVPEIPGTPPPVPEIPGTLPSVPPLPTPSPSVPELPSVPAVPDIAPPPELPGITDPEEIN
ncbi:hypothetical protein V2O64_08105 [Verrucomicrobiaceae bacterium 227]